MLGGKTLDTGSSSHGPHVTRASQVPLVSATLPKQLLQAAEAIGDARLIGDTYLLVGDVARARGDLAGAEQTFTQSLAISERLSALDPANTGWQRELAIAYNRVGDVAQARGDLAGAEQAFAQYLAIFERLAGLDPANTGWQRSWRSRTTGSVTWRRLASTLPGRSRRSHSRWPSPSG